MKNILLASSIFLFAQTFAQKSDCENLKNELAEAKKQNNYYKETLNLLKPLSSASANDLQFEIISAAGNGKVKAITVTYIFKNISSTVRKSFQVESATMVDVRGNQSQTYDAFANATQTRIENVQPNVPLKGILKFKVEETDFPFIKVLNVKFYYLGSDIYKSTENITFENIPVQWK